jgi:hypothetical protein
MFYTQIFYVLGNYICPNTTNIGWKCCSLVKFSHHFFERGKKTKTVLFMRKINCTNDIFTYTCTLEEKSCTKKVVCRVRVMVFNATYNNIPVISWQTVLLVEETGVPGENHQPATSY